MYLLNNGSTAIFHVMLYDYQQYKGDRETIYILFLLWMDNAVPLEELEATNQFSCVNPMRRAECLVAMT